MVFFESLVDKLVGHDFEIECHDIEVHGIRDHSSPLFKGPGVITGKERGAISFRIHNQIKISENLLREIFNQKSIDNDEVIQARFFAKDYDNNEWVGGWFIPNVMLSTSGMSVVHGEFDQISTQVKRFKGDNRNNTTDLIFTSIPNLPLNEIVEEKILHRGKEIFSSASCNRHELEFNGSKIKFYNNSRNDLFYITADTSKGFTPPFIENWIPEALMLITASLTYPRMIIRHFENDSLIFLRNTPPEIKSQVPSVIIRSKQELWNIFIAYLTECIKCNEFENLPTTKIFSEIILASTSTIQAFILSLSVCVENLASQLANEVDVETIENEVFDDLKSHIQKWPGNDLIKTRVEGLLPMIKQKSTSHILRVLREENVISNDHYKAWNKTRNFVAHGGILDFREDKDLWLKRNLLISMVYRLILRKIGYKGFITDYTSSNFETVEFQWEKKLSDKV